jgi:hypothetical protein
VPYQSGADCLDCYRIMETCLLEDECVPGDPKYVTVETLKRLIFRDCPIKNAGPCPKRSPAPCPEPEPCLCPTVTTELTTLSTPCYCPEVTTQTPEECPSCPDCICPVCAAPLIDSVCPIALEKCEESLSFTDLSKGGAQGERITWKSEAQRLREDLNITWSVRDRYKVERDNLAGEVRNCSIKIESLTRSADLYNVTITDMNATYDNCSNDLIECKGNLSLSEFCHETLKVVKQNETGITAKFAINDIPISGVVF